METSNALKVYRCKTCNGEVKFDVKQQKFACSACKTEYQLDAASDAVHENPYEEYDMREKSAKLSGVKNAECDNCGAEMFFGENDTTAKCPMCGSTKIRELSDKPTIEPDGIIPFKIDEYDASQRFRKWISKRFFAPSALKKAYQDGGLTGYYVPFWSFDLNATGDYVGKGGKDVKVQKPVAAPQNQPLTKAAPNAGAAAQTRPAATETTETVTQWTPVSGAVSLSYNDNLYCATNSASARYFDNVEPFSTTTAAKPYAPGYLVGYSAERYSIDAKTTYGKVESQVRSELRSSCESEIKRQGFDKAQVTGLNVSIRDVTYKSLLLPVYSAKYSYKGKTYEYVINGETGRTWATFPRSALKLIAAWLIVIGAIVGLIILLGR